MIRWGARASALFLVIFVAARQIAPVFHLAAPSRYDSSGGNYTSQSRTLSPTAAGEQQNKKVERKNDLGRSGSAYAFHRLLDSTYQASGASRTHELATKLPPSDALDSALKVLLNDVRSATLQTIGNGTLTEFGDPLPETEYKKLHEQLWLQWKLHNVFSALDQKSAYRSRLALDLTNAKKAGLLRDPSVELPSAEQAFTSAEQAATQLGGDGWTTNVARRLAGFVPATVSFVVATVAAGFLTTLGEKIAVMIEGRKNAA
ncbi:MAG: hypothetical protein AAF266_11875 [Planctomycetota bacterium]